MSDWIKLGSSDDFENSEGFIDYEGLMWFLAKDIWGVLVPCCDELMFCIRPFWEELTFCWESEIVLCES